MHGSRPADRHSRACPRLAPIIARTDHKDVRYRPTSSSRQDRRRLHRQGRQRQVHDGLAPARQQVRTRATRDFSSRGPSNQRVAISDDREPFEGMTSSSTVRELVSHRNRALYDGLFLYPSIPSVAAVRAAPRDPAATLRSFETHANEETLLHLFAEEFVMEGVWLFSRVITRETMPRVFPV